LHNLSVFQDVNTIARLGASMCGFELKINLSATFRIFLIRQLIAKDIKNFRDGPGGGAKKLISLNISN